MTLTPDRSDPDTLSAADALTLVCSRLRDASSDADLRRAIVVLERETAVIKPPSIGQLERDVERLDAQVEAIRARRLRPGAEHDPDHPGTRQPPDRYH